MTDDAVRAVCSVLASGPAQPSTCYQALCNHQPDDSEACSQVAKNLTENGRQRIETYGSQLPQYLTAIPA